MSTQRLMMTFGFMLAGAAGCMGGGTETGPATCAEAQSAYSVHSDGPQTLYVGGDKSMPWSAFCVGMASSTPQEFLELPQFDALGHQANYSQFGQATANLMGPDGFVVVTHYDKVRVDPVGLTIDITDKTFTRTEAPTTPTGQVVSPTLNNMPIAYMPFGAAMQCGAMADTTGAPLSANANIYLSTTPFSLADTQMCATAGHNLYVPDPTSPQKAVTFYAAGVTATDVMTCGRASVHCLPDPTANGEVGGQTTIPLIYAAAAPGFGF